MKTDLVLQAENEIYNDLYDPKIEDPKRYSRDIICVWVKAI